MPEKLELTFAPEDRYDRFRLISWWDQERLQQARVMVIGAGAIGNEVIKNLALLGVGKIYIVDMDRVERSNLSRSVLFRPEDEGTYKARAAARGAARINPDVTASALVGNVISDVGLGLFRHVDVVIGGLDNREARVAINQKCWLAGTPWIDGGIEVLHGVARGFFPPEGPCYECTMTEQDYLLLEQRRSCALLSRQEMEQGKVPTTPTTSAVIAGIQVQEALKLLHGQNQMPLLKGRGYVFNGLSHDSYVVEYTARKDCPAHETAAETVCFDEARTDELTLGELLERVRAYCGPEALVELNHDLVIRLYCNRCSRDEPLFRLLYTVQEEEGKCPDCQEMRVPEITHRLLGGEPFLHMTLAQVGIPPWDIVAGRQGLDKTYFELCGDKDAYEPQQEAEEHFAAEKDPAEAVEKAGGD